MTRISTPRDVEESELNKMIRISTPRDVEESELNKMIKMLMNENFIT